MITRKQFARMASLFAMNVLHKVPDTSLTCFFMDMERENQEMRNAASTACQLRIMGIDKTGEPNTTFNPDGNLTKAQFGTLLSRLLWGDRYDLNTEDYYRNHLLALQKAKIMTDIDDPQINERIGDIMVMLMRAANQ